MYTITDAIRTITLNRKQNRLYRINCILSDVTSYYPEICHFVLSLEMSLRIILRESHRIILRVLTSYYPERCHFVLSERCHFVLA